MNYILMFSGGRTSAFLAQYFKLKHNFNKKVAVYYGKGRPVYHYLTNDAGDKLISCFLNTGKEVKKTLDFVDKCDKEWDIGIVYLEAVINPKKGVATGYKIVNRHTASIKGEPFLDMLTKYPMPNNAGISNCTRELKQRPTNAFAKAIGWKDYTRVIGIRADEKHRKSNTQKDQNIIYPLADEFQVTGAFIRSWWSKQSFDLGLKDYEGNCDLCFKKSLRKRLTLINENPDIAIWWANIEDKYADEYEIEGIVGRRYLDNRNGLSIHDLVRLAKQPFTRAIDLHELSQQQQELFDIETDCFCKAN